MKTVGKKERMKFIFWFFFIALSVSALMSQSLSREQGRKKYGNYYIGQDFLQIKSEVLRISSNEYAALNRFFNGGKIYHGKDIEYLDNPLYKKTIIMFGMGLRRLRSQES